MGKKGMRILAIVLVLACLVGTVAVAAVAGLDKNGDGIVNIWDAQKVFLDDTIAEGDKTTLLNDIKTDILSAVSNATQISTPEQLQSIATAPDANYILAADIDMQGAAWTPVAGFSGIFDGNGYSISNVTINAADAAGNVGFFGSVALGGAVDNLSLKNVAVTVPAAAQNVGLIAGSNAGEITRSTVTGSIADTAATATIGIAVGSNTGSVQLDGFSVGEGTNESYNVNVAAQVQLNLANATCGMIGSGNAATGNTMWRDTTYSTSLLAAELQARRQAAVDHMTEMATVKWTPVQTMTDYMYYNTSNSITTFTAGVEYTGLPYNNGSGSLARFEYALLQDGATVNGVHNAEVTDGSFLDKDSLYMGGAPVRALQGIPNEGETYYTTASGGAERLATIKSVIESIDKEYLKYTGNYEGMVGINLAGFGRWLGNDCSSSLVYAWWQVSNANVAKNGVSANAASEMRPSNENVTAMGIQKINGFTYADGVNPTDTQFAEAYARAGQADVIACGDHVRLLAYDPVVIRNADGAVNSAVSYMITIGHGGVSGSNSALDSATKWGYLCKYTFAELMAGTAAKKYYPATIDALNNVDSQAAVANTTVTMSGTTITSDAQIVSVQAGSVVFFTGVEQAREYDPDTGVEKGFRDVYTMVDLSTEEEFNGADLTNITVTLADGSEWTLQADGTFAK